MTVNAKGYRVLFFNCFIYLMGDRELPFPSLLPQMTAMMRTDPGSKPGAKNSTHIHHINVGTQFLSHHHCFQQSSLT